MSKDNDEEEGTSVEIGGIKFTGGKMVAVFVALSATVGSLYGAFEVYKDYTDMKEMIQEYVAPDLSGIYQKLAVLEESTTASVEYTRDINNTLRGDIRRLETIVDSVDRSSKQSQRETDVAVREMTREVGQSVGEINREMNRLSRETAEELRNIRNELDRKIQQALDNPLAGM